MSTLRRLAAPAVLGVLALALAGCDSTVSTRVQVTSARTSTISAAIVFTGDAATVLESRPALQRELGADFAKYAGGEPERSARPGAVVYSSALTYHQLTSASGVLGVASASIGTDVRTHDPIVSLRLVAPTALKRAIASAVASEPDHVALAATMEQNTSVSVTVGFPGAVTAARVIGGDQSSLAISGTSATYARPLSRFAKATLEVEGSLSAGSSLLEWLAIPVLIAAVAGALLFFRRRAGARRLVGPKPRRSRGGAAAFERPARRR